MRPLFKYIFSRAVTGIFLGGEETDGHTSASLFFKYISLPTGTSGQGMQMGDIAHPLFNNLY